MLLRLLNITLLSAWALFLVWLLTSGKSDLIRLIHPRLWWVLSIAVVVLVFFLLSLIIPLKQAGKNNSILSELPGILILLIPLLYFLLAKEARLDGASLQMRLTQDDNGLYLNNLPPFEIYDEPNLPDMSFSRILRQPEQYENQQVEIICQSFVDENLPENIAMCYRYLITCCAADALPAFVFLDHEQELEIENDRWIKVNGEASVIRNNDMVFPSVKVEQFTYVEEPDFPWAM